MCDKCTEQSTKIALYRKLAVAVLDQAALDGIQFFIAKYEADKQNLDPKE
jgi:hypothetical protein